MRAVGGVAEAVGLGIQKPLSTALEQSLVGNVTARA